MKKVNTVEAAKVERRGPFVRDPYNYDADRVSYEAGLTFSMPSLAQQAGKEEADINTIARRFGLTGVLPQGVRMPTYGDFTGIGDYREALDAMQGAMESFMRMPAEVRSRFDNDPALFVDFCSDEANYEEAKKLGLVRQDRAGEASDKGAGGTPPPASDAPKGA